MLRYLPCILLVVPAIVVAQSYTTTTTTTTTTRQADGTVKVETTQTQSQGLAYSQARCQRLRIDEGMLIDQVRRTGWKLEQAGASAELARVQEELINRGC